MTSRRPRAREEVSAGGVVYRLVAGPDGATGGDQGGRGDNALHPVFLLIRDSYGHWGLPKGHVEPGEGPEGAARREVREETGVSELEVDAAIATIDWFFRLRGRLVHKVCHFYLMRAGRPHTCPQRDEGITACRWVGYEEAAALVSYANARGVLARAHGMLARAPGPPAGSADDC